jgi:hypothetical protein
MKLPQPLLSLLLQKLSQKLAKAGALAQAAGVEVVAEAEASGARTIWQMLMTKQQQQQL